MLDIDPYIIQGFKEPIGMVVGFQIIIDGFHGIEVRGREVNATGKD